MNLRARLAPVALAGTALLALTLSACSSSAGAAGSTESAQPAAYAASADTIVFGVVPDSADTQTNYQPLMDYLAGFKGKKVCFVDPSSTSGYLFPSYNLLKAGIDPQKDVTPVFAGKHDISVQKTGEGTECEAGFAEDSEVAKSDKVTVVQKTKVPGAPITVSDTLPADEKAQVEKVLANVTIDQIIAAGIKGADSDGFRSVFYATSPVDDKYYDLIRDICAKTHATQCQ